MLTTLQRDGETSPRAVAEACSRRTDGVIDRSRCEILRGTQWSAQGRDPVWDSRRGTHLGSGHVWPRQQTEHMIAIASIHALHSPCKPGAVHIWVPAGVYPRLDRGRGRGRAESSPLLRPLQPELPDQRAPLLLFGAAIGAQVLDRRCVERDQPDRFDLLFEFRIG